MRGVYVLVISVNSNIDLAIGALGKLDFKKGLYAYVGSAQNNLEKRVQRHLRPRKKKFWHIDYLLSNPSVSVLKVFHKGGGRPDECNIARGLGKRGRAVSRFGSSDCRCDSHLFKIEDYEFLSDFMSETEL